ncbi:protein kinase family protein [Frankia sp. AgKG'84/4]
MPDSRPHLFSVDIRARQQRPLDDDARVGSSQAGAEPAGRRRGQTVRLAGRTCLLEGNPTERLSGDGSWVLREGTASLVDAARRHVWYRQVLVRRPGDRASALLATVDGQLRLLAEIGDQSGLPTLVAGQLTATEGVLLSTLPPGRTWRDVFGPPATGRARAQPASARPAPAIGPAGRAGTPARMAPPTRSRAIALLRAAAGAGDVLADLHAAGHSHRAMTPDAVVLPAAGWSRPTAALTPALRDLGLAAVTRQAGEGPAEYRAPEQEKLGLHCPRIGSRTDVFRLAAMAYHGLAGVAPTRGWPAPLRGCHLPFAVPQTLDEVLLRALDLDPARRPARIRVLSDAFRLGAYQLARAGR